MQTAERISHRDASDNFVFQRSLLAYHEAAGIVRGRVLEIGTGSGYGVDVVAPHAESFVSIDKHNQPSVAGTEKGAATGVAAGAAQGAAGGESPTLLRAKVPPLPFPSGSFDTVITFQVIEHIRRDSFFVEEVARVLKPDGQLIISTPNAAMSLTRNPWHVREYTPAQFEALLKPHFAAVDGRGVFGRENVMEYFEQNRLSVARVARWDVLGLRNWLPRWLLKVPYDVLNRLNRRRLLRSNDDLTRGIAMSDYYLAPVAPECFDLFYIAKKL